MKEILKQQMEVKYEIAVAEAFKNNPFEGTPFEGMNIVSAISTTAETFKSGLKRDKIMLGLSEVEIEVMVDEVTTKIYNKYIEH